MCQLLMFIKDDINVGINEGKKEQLKERKKERMKRLFLKGMSCTKNDDMRRNRPFCVEDRPTDRRS